jgi:hypothetical protein
LRATSGVPPAPIVINAVDPGVTKTDLNGNTGIQTVEQGADIIVRMAQAGPDGPTGGFFNTDGAVPWWTSGSLHALSE